MENSRISISHPLNQLILVIWKPSHGFSYLVSGNDHQALFAVSQLGMLAACVKLLHLISHAFAGHHVHVDRQYPLRVATTPRPVPHQVLRVLELLPPRLAQLRWVDQRGELFPGADHVGTVEDVVWKLRPGEELGWVVDYRDEVEGDVVSDVFQAFSEEVDGHLGQVELV